MIGGLLKLAGKLLGRNKLSIVIYHQVMKEHDPMRPSEPDADRFRWQMALLKKYFTPLALPEAITLLKQGKLPPNAVCVTFDDGYLNNLQVAQPILAEFGIPATVYVATGFSHGQNMWNDRLIDLFSTQEVKEFSLAALGKTSCQVDDWESRRMLAYSLIPDIKYLDYQERQKIIDALYTENNVAEKCARMMTPEQIVELSQRNIDIGAHTVDHPILCSHSLEEQEAQIRKSKETLESTLGKPVVGFAYPNGKIKADYSQDSVEIVKSLGFQYAVSTNWGISDGQSDVYQLNRFIPWDKTPTKFHLRLIRNLLGI